MTNLPVPNPRTAVAGEFETAAYLNMLRDAINFLTRPPQARLHQAAAQSIANNAFSPIAFDSTDTDTYSGHSNTTNNTRYTAQAAGTYLLMGGVSTATSAAGFRQLAFRVNAGTSIHKLQGAPSPSFETALNTAASVPLNVGDYIEFGIWQNSGGPLSTVVADQSVWPWMDVYFISS